MTSYTQHLYYQKQLGESKYGVFVVIKNRNKLLQKLTNKEVVSLKQVLQKIITDFNKNKTSITNKSVIEKEEHNNNFIELNMKNEIERSLKEDDIIMYKQKIEWKGYISIKYECLVRMKNKKGEIVPPIDFLDVAKKYNLYTEISKKVIEKSFKYFNDKNIYFTLNLSKLDFENLSVMKTLVKHLKNYKKNNFILEITENEELTEKNILLLNRLKEKYNFQVALDDYGSGNNNAKKIIDIKPDIIKIDGSIIKDILKDKYSKTILLSMVFLARKLNKKIIAEYVSEEKIYNYLKNLDIEGYQGYFISKPIPINS